MLGYVSLNRAIRGNITALFLSELPLQLTGTLKGIRVIINHQLVPRYSLTTITTGAKQAPVVTVYVNDTNRPEKGIIGYVDFNLAVGKYEVYILKGYRRQNIEIEFDLVFKEQ